MTSGAANYSQTFSPAILQAVRMANAGKPVYIHLSNGTTKVVPRGEMAVNLAPGAPSGTLSYAAPGTVSHPATTSEPSSIPVTSKVQVSSATSLPAGVTTHPVSTHASPPTGGSTGSTVSSPGEIHSAVAPPSWSASSLTTTQWAIILAVVGAAILLLVLTLG